MGSLWQNGFFFQVLECVVWPSGGGGWNYGFDEGWGCDLVVSSGVLSHWHTWPSREPEEAERGLGGLFLWKRLLFPTQFFFPFKFVDVLFCKSRTPKKKNHKSAIFLIYKREKNSAVWSKTASCRRTAWPTLQLSSKLPNIWNGKRERRKRSTATQSACRPPWCMSLLRRRRQTWLLLLLLNKYNNDQHPSPSTANSVRTTIPSSNSVWGCLVNEWCVWWRINWFHHGVWAWYGFLDATRALQSVLVLQSVP